MLIVDAMNVIGSRPDGWWRDRAGAVRLLVGSLEAYAAASGEEVCLVVDGRPVEGAKSTRGVRVVFASRPGRDAADDDIVRMVAEADDPTALQVVTSDAELARRVRALGADVVAAGTFRRRLDAPLSS